MAERKSYDWEAIEHEYRTGKLSNRQLGKKHGWEKDLSQQVEVKVRTKLVRTKVRT